MSGNIRLPPIKPSPRRIMQAKYDDTCGVCLGDINQGDNIEISNGTVIHYGCNSTVKEDDG